MKTPETSSQIPIENLGLREIPNEALNGYTSVRSSVAVGHEPDRVLDYIVRAKREWEATLDAVSDLILLTDEKGTIMRCNRAVAEAFHTSYQGLIGRSFGEVFYGAGEAIPEIFTGNGSTGKKRREIQFPRLTGWFAVARHPIRTQGSGEVHGVVYTLADITERKRAESAFQQEAAVTAALAQVGRELLATLTPEATLQRFCQLTCETLDCDASSTFLYDSTDQAYKAVAGSGYTPEQWAAVSVLRLPKRAMAALLHKLEKEEVVQIHTGPCSTEIAQLLRQPDISAVLCVALRRRGQIVGVQTASYQGCQRQFTPRQKRVAKGTAQIASLALENARLLEEAEQANRLKSEFLATMSHELRTPLNIVLGYTELLLAGDFGRVTAEQADCLGRMEKSAGQLLELINTTLDVSRLEANRLQVEITEIDVATLIEELRQETAAFCWEKPELRVEWKVAPDLSPLRTDRTKLKVVLKHVFHNAVKFTERGSVAVDTHTDDGGVEICVADTGIGIAPETLPVIFEMFRQGEKVLTRRYGGVGIGLYIVRQLLNLLGGTITVESRVGEGSTFRIWVPNSEKAAPCGSSQTGSS